MSLRHKVYLIMKLILLLQHIDYCRPQRSITMHALEALFDFNMSQANISRSDRQTLLLKEA